MNKVIKHSIYIYFSVLLLSSCGIYKHIPEGQRLYTGAKIVMESDSLLQDVDALKADLRTVLRPAPNSKVLGMRPGLYYYYKNQKDNPGFLNRWLYKKFGETPVYQSDVKTFEVGDVLVNRLENKGFLYSTVASKFEEKNKEAALTYTLKVSAPYTIEAFKVDTMPSPLFEAVKKETKNTLLLRNNRFDLSHLKQERQRIETELKNKGYYNLNADFFIFEADTNQYKKKRFDLFLTLKAQVPQKAKVPYEITKINIYPNYDLNKPNSGESQRFNGKTYVQNPLHFKPRHLDNFITLNEGDLYNPQASKNTSRRLSTIGAYKYINIQYSEIDSLLTTTKGALEANIFLSPLTKRAFRAEIQAVTKSNNFTGPNLALTYSNRNIFKGGETLNISTNIGYETQFASGENAGLSSLEYGLKGKLIFPRVISPFSINNDIFKYSIPKTKTSLGVSFLQRSKLYTLGTGSARFGYIWNANRYITYEINPISIDYTSLNKSSEEFDDILNNNPFLRRSFEQQFISGLTFSFTYNEMIDSNDSNQFFLNSTLDVAGNSISLLGQEDTTDAPKTFLGLEYAQYAKADVDVRFHHNFGKNKGQTIATRLFAGYGLAYGNSEIIPFVKQYFSGGPYSIRAFRIRSLGPGTYNGSANSTGNNGFFDQTGNIRLEANAEYRFPIYSFFKGALFVDAGNVWNSRANPTFNGDDKFTSNFINELGMGTGFGLRIDVQGFVIRFDLAAPFHDPSLPEGQRIDFQIDQPVLNFAIGYSF